jgi:hypothetical protein
MLPATALWAYPEPSHHHFKPQKNYPRGFRYFLAPKCSLQIVFASSNDECLAQNRPRVPKLIWMSLKGLSHQIFKAFLWPTILNLYFLRGRWWLFKFFHLVVMLIFWRYNFNVHRAEQCIICKRFTKAACDLLPRLPFSHLCITSGFPLATCDAQAGSPSPFGEFANISGLVKSSKGIRKRLKGIRLWCTSG